MRRAAKKDANHGDIAGGLEGRGWDVHDTSRLGGGFPDLIVARQNPFSWKRFTAVVEIKVPGKKLNKLQEDFKRNWDGAYVVAETIEQAHADLCQLMSSLEICKKCGAGY